MDVQTTPAKAQRASYQHSRNGAASTPAKTNGQQGQRSTNKRRGNQNAHPHQIQHAPAWDGANVSDSNEGYFDSNGKFVNGQQDSSAPDDSPAPAKGKKGRAKHNHHDNVGQSMPQSHMATAQAIAAGTPAKVAYAGPTFHASPAASALPKPSFMSKSVPGDAKPSVLQARLDLDNDNSGSSTASTPLVAENKPSIVAPPREESPLEFFFKADRAEKSKTINSTGPSTPNGKPSFSVAQSAPAGNNWSNIYQQVDSRHHQRTDSSQSQRGVFALELDGTGVQPGRSPVHQSQVPQPATAPRPASHAEQDPIRKFLYETANGSSPSSKASLHPPEQVSGYSSDQPGTSPFYRQIPQQLQRSSSGPSTPAPQLQQANNNFHYGNRNLSPLFQAAKSPPPQAPSHLRRELGPSSPQHDRPHQQWTSIYQPQPGQHLTPPPDRFNNGLPPVTAIRSNSYGAPSPNAPPSHDTRSMEDDLRRILKLTASSNGAGGVQ